MTTLGAHPARVDIEAYAGSPIDVTIAVTDPATGEPVASLAGWTVAAIAQPGGPPQPLTAVINSATVRITATGEQTRTWRDVWPVPVAPWDVVLTDPADKPHPPLAAGWIMLYPTHSR